MDSFSAAMDMNPNLAKRLFAEGANLIITGCPIGTDFGIDLCSYTIGENFRGVKMIPTGPHYVWCASKGPYGDVAPRVGFVHYFKSGEILVREWDAQNEELRERQIEDAELEKSRIRKHLLDLDRYLAPYDYRFVKQWKQLTDEITEETLERCRPALGTIRTNIELQSCPDSERPRGAEKPHIAIGPHMHGKIVDENDLLPNLKPIEGTGPRFTVLPQRVPKDAQPSEITENSMDCIKAIDALMASFPTTKDLIEEIQLSYVFFLVGFSIESLSQWRKILHLLANSETAVEKYKLLYMKYSEVLGRQLPHLPEELMEPTEHNTVYKDVRSLLVNLNANCLNMNANCLMNDLSKSMKWEFPSLEEEDPEDLPTVVEIS